MDPEKTRDSAKYSPSKESDNKLRLIRHNKVPRRIPTNRKFWEKNKTSAGVLRPFGEINNPCSVAGEISDRGINLTERDLHLSSLRQISADVEPLTVAREKEW